MTDRPDDGDRRLSSLRESARCLAQHPPATGPSEQRLGALKQLDEILMDPRQTAEGGGFDIGGHGRTPPHNPIRDLYVEQMRAALSEIKTTVVEAGITVWQLYNMGIVVKTPQVTLGFDVVRGLRWHDWSWEVPPDIVDGLVQSLDVLLVTHYVDNYHRHPGVTWLHVDHYDEAIVEGMQQRGKPVFIPTGHEPHFDHDPRFTYAQHRQSYDCLGTGITAHGGRHIYQDTPFDTPLMLYEVATAEGQRIVFAGDFDYTTSDAALGDGPIDLLVLHAGGVSPQYDDQNPNDLGDDDDAFFVGLQRFRAKAVLASHLAELSHPPGGGRESYLMALDICRQLDGKSPAERLVLFWGESFHLPP